MAQPSLILAAANATGAGTSVSTIPSTGATFQAYGTTTAGSGSATINIEVSNNRTEWLTLGTITLTLGTSAVSDGFAAYAAWAFVRANVTALSGTGASVTVSMAT